MGRAPCCEKGGLKKGPWTPDEDQKLVSYIQRNGHGSWRALPKLAGLLRCGKSCRLRWTNYLRPDIKRGRFSVEEEQMIVHLHAILGNRWSAIATHLPMRTDNEIKNYWNTHLKKRLCQMGIDPVTHKATSEFLINGPDLKPIASSKLSHMSQWDCARMEAEARLSSKLSATRPRSSFELNTEQLKSNAPMRSWNQVTQTRRPDFGLVETEKTPQRVANFQKLLRDWETSLQDQSNNNVTFGSSMHSESSASEVLSMQGSCLQGLENLGVSSLMLHQSNNAVSEPSLSSKSRVEFCPTSTPCSLESQASPCRSSAADSFQQYQSSFDFPLQSSDSGHPYQEFALDQVNKASIFSASSPIPVFPKVETGDCSQSSFWHDSLMESLKSEESMLPASLAASMSSSFELSSVELSACSSPETSSTVSQCLNSSLLPPDFLLDLESRDLPIPSLPKFEYPSNSQCSQTFAEIPQFDSFCRVQSANFDTSYSSITPFGRMHF